MTDNERRIKAFLGCVKPGEPLRVLFIVPSKGAEEVLKRDLFNEASSRGMCPIYRGANSSIIIGDSIAVLRIAYPRLHRELSGTMWHGIAGLECFDKYENTTEIISHFKALHRWPAREAPCDIS